jgi:hypothetical protein
MQNRESGRQIKTLILLGRDVDAEPCDWAPIYNASIVGKGMLMQSRTTGRQFTTPLLLGTECGCRTVRLGANLQLLYCWERNVDAELCDWAPIYNASNVGK